ncbi:MAG: phosphoribosylanthranilate isomerase [Pirellulaceae bacterium]|nr:phosphoribosylanthranilate isomerase [Pirellulaceae bacterium]
MPELFHIKICGITSPADAKVVVDSGADAVGINFFEGSKRFVEPAIAKQITANIPSSVAKVGVFVNGEVDWIETVAQAVGLDWIQLHGDESPELVSRLQKRPLLKAFRLTQAGLQPVAQFLADCEQLGRPVDALLLDAFHPTEFGGTGRTIDWQTLAAETALMGGYQWALAGGLTPVNVANAIAQARPHAVDTASGVESSPGKKDSALTRSFVEQARGALE